MSSRIFGSGIKRREDPRLITGAASYTDDLTLPGMLHAVMLRSPHAHAIIRSIDTSKAPRRTARSSLRGTWNSSRGRTPRGSGENQPISPPSTAIGKIPSR